MGAPGRFFGYPNMVGAYYLLLGPPLGAHFGLPMSLLSMKLMLDVYAVFHGYICALLCFD